MKFFRNKIMSESRYLKYSIKNYRQQILSKKNPSSILEKIPYMLLSQKTNISSCDFVNKKRLKLGTSGVLPIINLLICAKSVPIICFLITNLEDTDLSQKAKSLHFSAQK